MKKFAILFIKKYGINTYIAVKNQYNNSVGCSRFYTMVKNRLGLDGNTPKQLAASPTFLSDFLQCELTVHFKEYSQYQ